MQKEGENFDASEHALEHVIMAHRKATFYKIELFSVFWIENYKKNYSITTREIGFTQMYEFPETTTRT
jgi:hypothetical protein